MNTIERVDPELRAPLQAYQELTQGGLDLNDIVAARALVEGLTAGAMADAPMDTTVTSTDLQVPGPQSGGNVSIRVYRPADAAGVLPALLWMHGGGYVMGSIDGSDVLTRRIARELRCVVVSVGYRLAPEHPYPAALDDCYAALCWLAHEARSLDVDPTRIAIGGASAGGGLAACLALRTRDRAEVDIAFQLLIYPMLDDGNVAPASDTLPDTLLWTRENNRIGWRSYLGQGAAGADVSPYAAAVRATELAGLPPAYVSVGDLDLFLDENIEYARRLLSAGVATELHVYSGAYHGFNGFAPKATVSRRFDNDFIAALRRAFDLQR